MKEPYQKHSPVTMADRLPSIGSPINLPAIRKDVLEPPPPAIAKPLGRTLGDLLAADLPSPDYVITGLAMKQLGSIIAITNHGKTTLLRNLAISLACGRPFPPFTTGGVRRHVAFFDFEDPENLIKADMKLMVAELKPEERELAKKNIFIFAEAEIDGSELELNELSHQIKVISELESFLPDLIIIDTASRAFPLSNENDNSEVQNKVITPARRLAKALNAAVMFSHHIGKAKAEEGSVREGAHRGRGASALADQSKVIYCMDKDSADGATMLWVPKIKGPNVPEYVLRLDDGTRWFEAISGTEPISSYRKMLELFSAGTLRPTHEIIEEMKPFAKERVTADYLALALKRGDLTREKRGWYQLPTAGVFQ
jgi:hypothetical protein